MNDYIPVKFVSKRMHLILDQLPLVKANLGCFQPAWLFTAVFLAGDNENNIDIDVDRFNVVNIDINRGRIDCKVDKVGLGIIDQDFQNKFLIPYAAFSQGYSIWPLRA